MLGPFWGPQDRPTTGTGSIYRLTWACQALYKTSTQMEELQRSHEHLVGYMERRLVGYLGRVFWLTRGLRCTKEMTTVHMSIAQFAPTYIYTHIYIWSPPPPGPTLSFFLVVFTVKKQVFSLSSFLFDLYTNISLGVWFLKINPDYYSSRLIGTKSDSSCPTVILVKSLLKVLYTKHA